MTTRIANITSAKNYGKRGVVQEWAVIASDESIISVHTTREDARQALKRYNQPTTDK